jgi:Flp pilus assembly protein TadD
MEPGSKLTKLRRYAQLAPKDPEVHLALARELVEGSQAKEAATELQTVIALSPNHLEARKLLEGLTETNRR